MEIYLLKNAVETDHSVLGICRGIQLMNACFDGTLYQDLEMEYNSGIRNTLIWSMKTVGKLCILSLILSAVDYR